MQMDRGPLVTELLGHGVNYVTGDYSAARPASGSRTARSSSPCMRSPSPATSSDMLMGIREIGSDVLVRGSKHCGSILVDRMTVAGA